MRTLHRLGGIVFALGLALVPPAAGAATPVIDAPAKAAPTDPVYASDLRAFLDSVHTYENALKGLRQALPADPVEREFVQACLASMTPDQFYAKALPVYARYIPPKQAATLGAMARKRPVPLGQQQMALQSYWDMQKQSQAKADFSHMWRELGTAFAQHLNARSVAEIRRAIAELGEYRGTGHVVKVNRVGLPSLDRLTWLSVNNVMQQMNASDTMERGCQAAGIQTAMRASNLMAENGVAAARQALDSCEHALETMEKTSDAAFKQTRADMLALRMPAGAALAEQLDKAAAKFYDYGVKYGELTRQGLQAQRSLVSLVESRRATIQVKDDRLLFSTDEDLAEANRDIAEIRAREQALNDFIYQQRQRSLLHDIDLHDGVTASPAAPPAPAQ